MKDPVLCAEHPEVVAAWRCDECETALCLDCGAPDALGKLRIVRCMHCRGLAEPIRYAPDIVPFEEMLLPFGKVLITSDSLVQLAAIAFILAILSLGFFIGDAVGFLFVTTYYLMVVKHASLGGKDLPMWEGGQVTRTVFGFMVASAWIWAPVCGYAGLVGNYLRDPLAISLGVLGAFLIPAAIMAAATRDSMVELVDPRTSIAIIRSSPSDYTLAASVWLGTVMLDRAVEVGLDQAYDAFPIPFLVPLVLRFVGLFIPVFSALLLGRLMYQHAIVLGLYRPEDLVREQVPNATAKGMLEPVPQPLEEEPLPMDLDLAVDVSAPIAEPPPPPPFEEDRGWGGGSDIGQDLPTDDGIAIELADLPGETLAGAIEAGADARVLGCYEDMEQHGGLEYVPADQLIAVAGAYERARKAARAAKAWQRAVQCDSSGPFAPDAILGLALLLQRLDRDEEARGLFKRILTGFPGHAAAVTAREALGDDDPADPPGGGPRPRDSAAKIDPVQG